jgi:hypothetical protein
LRNKFVRIEIDMRMEVTVKKLQNSEEGKGKTKT